MKEKLFVSKLYSKIVYVKIKSGRALEYIEQFNCLDNAIDACDKLDDSQIKQITLTSKISGTHIVFKIVNSFNGKLNKINNVIQSSKEEPGHGIGLSSIHETVNRYNGNVDYKYTEDKFGSKSI